MGQRKRSRASGANTKAAAAAAAPAPAPAPAESSSAAADKSGSKPASPSKEPAKDTKDAAAAAAQPEAANALHQGPVYLDFLDEISDLHTEVGRKFMLMKTTDYDAQDNFKAARKAMKTFWKCMERGDQSKADEFHNNAKQSFASLLANSDEKIAIANDLHASIDRHLRSLTETLNAFHKELEEKGQLPTLPDSRLAPMDPIAPGAVGLMSPAMPEAWAAGPSPLGSSSQLLSPMASRMSTTPLATDSIVGTKRKFEETTVPAAAAVPGLAPEERERKLQRIIEAAKTDAGMKSLLEKIQATASSSSTPSAAPKDAKDAKDAKSKAGSTPAASTSTSSTSSSSTTGTAATGAAAAASATSTSTAASGAAASGATDSVPDKASLLDAMDAVTAAATNPDPIAAAAAAGTPGAPLTHEQAAAAAMAAAGPEEPTYCLCNRVSFGEMVGCDNPSCPREWFHFACVGLVASPKGAWLCPDCASKKRKK